MADARQGVEFEVSVKNATQQGVETSTKTVVEGAKKAETAATSAVENIAKRAVQLPGALGQIQKALGGVLGTATAVIGAFKAGWDIGSWLNDKVINPLLGIKDPLEELKRHNKELEEALAASAARFEESMEEWAAGWSKVADGTNKAREKVEDLAEAYLKMHAARERGEAAAGDAALLEMQRDKFDAMANAETPEQAAQLGKWHDVLIAEEKARQEMSKFDRESEASAARQEAAELALREALSKRVGLKRQMKELDEKLAYMQSQASVDEYGLVGSAAMEKELAKAKAALQANLDATSRDVEKRKADVAAMSASRANEAQERENLVARTRLEIDEKKRVYDEYAASVEQAEAKRAEEEWRSQQDAIRRAAELELAERQKLERDLAAERLADVRREIQERGEEERSAARRLEAARAQVTRAWGWYRDKDSLRAQIEEEKADAAAQAQFEKDFEKLRFRRDWREAKDLSLDEEAVRRVALAKEEEDAAERHLAEIEKNTADLVSVLEKLAEGGE